MRTFRSVFANRLADYVKLRQGLGLQFRVQAALLLAFDRYVYEQGYKGPLTQEFALEFAGANAGVSENECARRYQVIRHFSDYLAVFEPETPWLEPEALPRSKSRPVAYIYTEKELEHLLEKARHISPKNPIRGITLHAMVGLAASTGLRISEVVRLDKADVDLENGVLSVRRTKFAKDRLVPLHSTTLRVLRNYAGIRDATFPTCDCPAFFINMWPRRFARNTLQLSFWDLTRQLGLRGEKGKGPSFHDLRHTFAVRRLVAWYKEGVDVQAMLPALATYLGHVHYTDTAYYITAIPELMALAADRYNDSLERRK